MSLSKVTRRSAPAASRPFFRRITPDRVIAYQGSYLATEREMVVKEGMRNLRRLRVIIRLLLLPNFLVLTMFVVPSAHRWVDRRAPEFQALGIAGVVGSLIPI
jgi:hypothetical protein